MLLFFTRRMLLGFSLCFACSGHSPPLIPVDRVGYDVEDPSQPSYSAEVEARIAAVVGDMPGGGLHARMRQYGVPGVSIAVVNQGVVEWARGFGVREAWAPEPVNTETLFQAASISKSITAMAVLSCMGGTLDIDRNVNDQLTRWRLPDNELTDTAKVTPKLLLSHMGGTTVHGFMGYLPGSAIPTLAQVLDGRSPANSSPVRVFVTPGTRWDYSGGGYEILEQLLVDTLGQSFPEIMRTRVLDPLGMKHSTFTQPLPDALAANAASAHRAGPTLLEGGGKTPPKWHVYPEMAAAGLWTTSADLAVFLTEIAQAYAGHSARVLPQTVVKEMLTVRGNNYGYGLGVYPGADSATVRFMHGGANIGYRALFVGITRVNSGVAIMTNSDMGDRLASEIVARVSGVYQWPRNLPLHLPTPRAVRASSPGAATRVIMPRQKWVSKVYRLSTVPSTRPVAQTRLDLGSAHADHSITQRVLSLWRKARR